MRRHFREVRKKSAGKTIPYFTGQISGLAARASGMDRFLVTIVLVSFSMATEGKEFVQPYILIGETGESVSSTAEDLVGSFFMNDIEVLGEYSPGGDIDRVVIAVTNGNLLKAVREGKPSAAFGAAMRVAVTKRGEMTYVSCQNPEFWGNAYFQEDYPKVESNVVRFKEQLLKSMPRMRGRFNRQFGSHRKLKPEDIRHYHYLFGMPYFEDMVKLGKFDSYEDASATIEKNLLSSDACTKVFEKEIPGRKTKLYGVALGGERGESHFLPIIDTGHMKRTAFLPYELLVVDENVFMLQGRFRIAASFPDMTLMTFLKVMSISTNIEEMMRSLVK